MEVHYHPHLHAGKKLKEYLKEGIVIFFAVTLGFIAENIREWIGDHKRERHYVRALIQDIQSDVQQLDSCVDYLGMQTKDFDTLLVMLNTYDSRSDLRKMYYHFVSTDFYSLFIPEDRTIQQLKNGAGLSAFDNWEASDSIAGYYATVRHVTDVNNTYSRYFDEFHRDAFKEFDYSLIGGGFDDRSKILQDSLHRKLLKGDPYELKIIYSKLFVIREIASGYRDQLKDVRDRGQQCIKYLKDAYSL